jgi:hypothetical protein
MFTLKFDDLNQVNMILTALGEMPAKASMGMILNIQNQIAPQVQAQEDEQRKAALKAMVPAKPNGAKERAPA